MQAVCILKKMKKKDRRGYLLSPLSIGYADTENLLVCWQRRGRNGSDLYPGISIPLTVSPKNKNKNMKSQLPFPNPSCSVGRQHDCLEHVWLFLFIILNIFDINISVSIIPGLSLQDLNIWIYWKRLDRNSWTLVVELESVFVVRLSLLIRPSLESS